MDFFSILKLVGGLALFLYGMSVMGKGLERYAGGRLEKTLESLTENPLKGFLFGAIVTALIQSSSATTVMVVGFVNSGIMRLSQAIGVVIGANVGTTVTAWILSLTGIEGSNALVMLLQPKNFSLIFAAIGVVMVLFSKSERKNNVGQVLLGFTILIYGMDFMSGAMSPLKNSPEFANLLVVFSNPIFGVLIGALVTALLQSSSASVGILQALSSSGTITFSSAIPIILGQNIGTCVTAMISCVGANKNAKRVAFIHLYFNVIGAIIFLGLVYLGQNLIGFAFWNTAVDRMSIAVIHTLFNVFSSIMFLPFTRLLEKLSYLTVKERLPEVELGEEFELLDKRFLPSPSIAMVQAQNAVIKMSGLAKINVALAMETMLDYSSKSHEQVEDREREIDSLDDKINSYLVKLTKGVLSSYESRYLSKLFHCVNDIERIGDHGENIVQLAAKMNEEGITFTKEATAELTVLHQATRDFIDLALKICETDDDHLALEAEPLEEVIDLLCDNLRNNHIERVKTGACSVLSGMYFNDLLVDLERIADHCLNISVRVIELKTAVYRSHEHVERENVLGYEEKLAMYMEKYSI